MTHDPAASGSAQPAPAHHDHYGASNRWSWLRDLAVVASVTALIVGITVHVAHAVLDDGSNTEASTEGLGITLAVVATYLSAFFYTWRYRAVPALVGAAGVMSAWQWFAYPLDPSNGWDMVAAGLIVGLSVALAAALLGLGRPLRHTQPCPPRAIVRGWATAASTLPLFIVWAILVEPNITTHAVTQHNCISASNVSPAVYEDLFEGLTSGGAVISCN